MVSRGDDGLRDEGMNGGERLEAPITGLVGGIERRRPGELLAIGLGEDAEVREVEEEVESDATGSTAGRKLSRGGGDVGGCSVSLSKEDSWSEVVGGEGERMGVARGEDEGEEERG